MAERFFRLAYSRSRTRWRSRSVSILGWVATYLVIFRHSSKNGLQQLSTPSRSLIVLISISVILMKISQVSAICLMGHSSSPSISCTWWYMPIKSVSLILENREADRLFISYNLFTAILSLSNSLSQKSSRRISSPGFISPARFSRWISAMSSWLTNRSSPSNWLRTRPWLQYSCTRSTGHPRMFAALVARMYFGLLPMRSTIC